MTELLTAEQIADWYRDRAARLDQIAELLVQQDERAKAQEVQAWAEGFRARHSEMAIKPGDGGAR